MSKSSPQLAQEENILVFDRKSNLNEDFDLVWKGDFCGIISKSTNTVILEPKWDEIWVSIVFVDFAIAIKGKKAKYFHLKSRVFWGNPYDSTSEILI